MIKIGTKFGRLMVLEFLGLASTRNKIYYCKCRCGNFTEVTGSNLRNGRTKSCGCYGNSYHIKHGLCGTRLYSIWGNMRDRCNNPNTKNYDRYGGRGIVVCREWRKDFKTFYDWAMLNGYSDDLQIDRIDNDDGYYPENCRFVTPRENCLNQRQIQINNTSGYKGVSIHSSGRYVASIMVHRESIYIGIFETAKEAVFARDQYIIDNNLNYKLQVLA